MAVEEVVLEGDIAKEDALKLLQQHGSADKLTLSNCRKLTTTDIQALIEAINSGLNSVTIKNCNIIDDDTLEKLAACCPKLTDVTLNGKFKKLTERGTINFAKSCQELKLFSVVLSETDESEEQEGDEEVEWGLTDNFLSGLSENTCPTLEHFGFSGFTGVTANGLLGFLGKVSPTLASLDCSEVPIITDTECREIAGICPGLTSINFSYCNITDKGVEELCLKCHLLNHIDFCGCNELTDNAVKSIATHCKKITNLKLGWCLKITETSLEALANECLSLGHKLLQQHGSSAKLTLSNCRKLTTTDIQALIEAINSGLNSVTIKNCNIIDDDTLEKLAACCPKLTDVTLNGKFKKLTERGTINFAKSCQELKLFSVVLSETDESEEQEGDEEVEWGLTDNFLSGLSENTCPTLEHFGFSGFTGVTANGLLGFLGKVSPTLASLDCSEVPIITDTECREIAGICPGLTSINFSYCNITDKGVEELCLKCNLLNHIDFCGCNELTDNAVKSIATHCKKITNLKLG
ncbi:predicted protein, partial [Nematostella vectensis]